MTEERPSPKELLQQIKMQEHKSSYGALKIFFGYAAGVGKTYAMLEAAHQAKSLGVNVVCGYIEPHVRPQTMARLEGLEHIPPREANHKGLVLRELDLDEVLRRKPALVLVDELAHTNAPGSRHEKRYQDVEELLHSGIDVYTTVNVQHIESLCDIVAAITGIIVRERIPDKIFDSAAQVELVDIEPADLMERLKAGKIYRPEQANRALEQFFTEEKLTALREIALRRTADQVNKKSAKQKRLGGGSYYTEENILVGLSSSPSNAKIIRAAARMADAFQGTFTALFVETPELQSMSDENKKRLRDNIHLAEQLGAKIETVYGEDIAVQIAEYARISGVSKIVVGRSNTRRRFALSKPSFSERLTALSADLDIYVIPDSQVPLLKVRQHIKKGEKLSMADFLKALSLFLGATGLGFAFFTMGFSEANIITVYILSVVLTSIFTSHRAYSLGSSILSVLAFNFFFTDPRYTLNAYDTGYPFTFLIMFISAFLTSSLAIKIKRQAKQSARTAYRTKILLDTNQLLQQEKDIAGIADVTSRQLIKLLKKDIVLYLPENGRLSVPKVYCADGGTPPAHYLNDSEQTVAAWVFQNDKHAGASTGTLGGARCRYLTIRSSTSIYGVIGIALAQEESLDALENSLVLSILSECALAMEKEQFRQKREEAQAKARQEQLRANLLRAISHDLRTPLTSISGNAGILMSSALPDDTRQQLYTDIYDDSMWLINLVENLLSVTRIEEGSMQIAVQAELLEEIVSEALKHIDRKRSEHQIQISFENDLQLIKADPRLIMQVIINLIDNAIKYTQPGSLICLRSKKIGSMVEISVADNGSGIPDSAKTKVFDMFYTAPSPSADSKRGLGLGLALCKTIVTAHDGTITVENNHPTGTIFRFTLPAEEVTLHE